MTNTFKTGRGATMTVTVGSTPTTFGAVIDCTIKRTADTIDGDCRDGDGRSAESLTFGATVPVGYKCEVDVDAKCRANDTVLAVLNAACQGLTPVLADIGDGGFGTGIKGYFYVSNMQMSQPKDDKVTTSFTLTLKEKVV